MSSTDPTDDAFHRFEWNGWQTIAGSYDRLLGPLTSRVVAPLLDAAGVGAGTRVLDWWTSWASACLK